MKMCNGNTVILTFPNEKKSLEIVYLLCIIEIMQLRVIMRKPVVYINGGLVHKARRKHFDHLICPLIQYK